MRHSDPPAKYVVGTLRGRLTGLEATGGKTLAQRGPE
jgi:hypothetical protein